MSIVWKTVINDYSTNPGTRIEQDVTNFADWLNVSAHKTASDLVDITDILLSFPVDTPGLNIREWQEIWGGMWDNSAGVWVQCQLAGFITKLVGGVNGGEHTIALTISGYNVLFDKVKVRGWPTLPDTRPPVGFPVDYSVLTWIFNVGGGVPDGIIPYHLEDVDYTSPACYSLIFDTVILDATNLPGNTSVLGLWEFIALRKIFEDIVDVTRYVLPSSHPMFYFVPKCQGDVIIPQFRYINMSNDAGDPLATFNINPGVGEYPFEQPFLHTRDGSGQQTYPTIVGVGGDPGIAGNPLVWAEYAHPDHWPNFYMPYIKSHKLEGAPIIDKRIKTLAMANDYIRRVETLTWGAVGSIEFNCRIDQDNPSDWTIIQLQPGDYVKIINPNEGQNTVYPIRDVTVNFSNPESWIVHLVVGRRQYGLEDIIIGGTADNPIIKGDTGYDAHGGRGFAGGASVAGVPRSIPPVLNPSHSDHNTFLAADKTIVSLKIEQALNTPGTGIPESLLLDTPVYNQANLIEAVYRDPDTYVATVKAYLASNFIWRPNFYPFYFRTNGTLKESFKFDTRISGVELDCQASGSETITYQTVSTDGLTTTTQTIPFNIVKGEKLVITVSGASSDFTLTLTDL